MKRLYLLMIPLLALASCQTNDLLEDYVQDTNIATRSVDDDDTPEPQYATANNIGRVRIGPKLSNYMYSFTIQNMGDALMDLKWRRPINPTDGRIHEIVGELSNITPFHLKTTHYYIKFQPADIEDIVIISSYKDLYVSSFPFDHEITGTGTLPHEPAMFDAATRTPKIVGPATELYSIVPVNKLPQGVKYEIIASLYMPHLLTEELANYVNTPYISPTFAEVLVEQALFRSGAVDIDDLLKEKIWRPYGQVQVYDYTLEKYVGVPNIKVHIYNKGRDICTYTDKNGRFMMGSGGLDFKGKVSYRIEWATDDYVIYNTAGELAEYYCGDCTNRPLDLKIKDGEAYGIATVARALSMNYYEDGNPFNKITDYYKLKLKVFYRHEGNDKNYGGKADLDGLKTWVTIWGYDKDDLLHETKSIFSNCCHELGHVAMYLGCLKVGKSWDNYDDLIVESWAKFTGWYLVMAEYNKYGFDVFKKVYGSNGVEMVYYDVPDWLNGQHFTQSTLQSGDRLSFPYTPLFIDLIDDSNQLLYYNYCLGNSSKNIYPNDDLCIDNPVIMEKIMSLCNNVSQVKSYLLGQKENLNISEEDINKYFKFYGV